MPGQGSFPLSQMHHTPQLLRVMSSHPTVQYYITSCMYVVSQDNCEQINDDNEKYSTCCTVCYGMLMEGGRDKQSSRKAVVLVVVVLESHIYNTLYRLVSR